MMNILEHASFSASDVSIESRENLFRGFIQVEKVTIKHRLFNKSNYSSSIHRELIHRPESAGVLLYDNQQRRFALIEQFRIGALNDTVSPWQLEVIAGVLDGDETPETCICRESLEEAGCEVQDLQHLFTFYPSAGACSEIFHLYVANVELPTSGGVFGMPDEGEDIQLHLFDYSDAPLLLKNVRLRNAPVIMALQWLTQHLRQQ